jgi:cell division protein FtsQ
MWHNVKALNATANLLMLLAIGACLAAFAFWFSARPMFVISDVVVTAAPNQTLRHASPRLMQAAVVAELKKEQASRFGSARYFFSVPLESVRASFEQLPWVRQASVRRLWPNKLRIEIEEHKTAAAWSDGRLVNTHGELFTANLSEAEEDGPLPQFAGPSDTSQQVLRRHAELVVWLAPLNIRPESLTLSTRHAWTVKLEDGTTLLLGREQGVAMEDRLTNWVASVPRLQAKLSSKPELYDLRYPNGFAVRSVALIDDEKKLDSKVE